MITVSLIVFGILLVVGGFMMDDVEAGAALAGFGMAVVIAGMLVWGFGILGSVLDVADYAETERNIEHAIERQEQIESIVRSELSTYPEFEADAYRDFIADGDSAILLQYPELRANAVVVEAAERYVETVDVIYEHRLDLERSVRRIEARLDNPFVPNLGLRTLETP